MILDMTRTRPGRQTETSEYVAFTRRILAAMGRRIAGHADHLSDLAALSVEVDAQLVRAVAAARVEGYSWTDIAAQLGCTRQAAQQRFAGKIAAVVSA